MSPILSNTQPGARPPAAVEISLEGVVAAAPSGSGQPPVYAFEKLPSGSVAPGIGEPNLRAEQAVAAAIRSALNELSPRTRAVTLVVPDTAVRVFVLDFDSLPSKVAEVNSVLRFRLRKMVPFDVEHAGVSYQLLSQKKDEVKVLAAVIPAPILAQYESAVRQAGYEPGAVLPSSLAALAAIDSMEAVLMTNLVGPSMTTAIANGENLLLYRNVELPEDPALRFDEIRRGIAVATAYFEDKLQARPRRLYYAGEEISETGLLLESRSSDGKLGHYWIDDPELQVFNIEPEQDPLGNPHAARGYASLSATTGALAGVR